MRHIVNQVVLQAVEHAADPTRFSEQLTLGGLETWQVQKVYAALAPGELGSANVTTSQVSTRWGRSLAELAAPARGLLTTTAAAPQAALGFRLLVDHVPQEQGKRTTSSAASPCLPAAKLGGHCRKLPGKTWTNCGVRPNRRNLQAILAHTDEKDPQADTRLARPGRRD